jgi:alpha-N-acetylglucosamine transferase
MGIVKLNEANITLFNRLCFLDRDIRMTQVVSDLQHCFVQPTLYCWRGTKSFISGHAEELRCKLKTWNIQMKTLAYSFDPRANGAKRR